MPAPGIALASAHRGDSDNRTMGRTAQGARLGAMVLTAALLVVARADAAGTAYGVDTAEVSEAGNCKVESWLSWASNQDFLAITNPSCVVNLGRPVELSVQLQRSRADGERSEERRVGKE